MAAVDLSGSLERSSDDASAPNATATEISPLTFVEVYYSNNRCCIYFAICIDFRQRVDDFIAGADFTFYEKSRSKMVTLSVHEPTGSLLILNKDTGECNNYAYASVYSRLVLCVFPNS